VEGAGIPAQMEVAIVVHPTSKMLARHHLDFTTSIVDLLQHQYSFFRQTDLSFPAFFLPHCLRTTDSHTKYLYFEHNRTLTIPYTPYLDHGHGHTRTSDSHSQGSRLQENKRSDLCDFERARSSTEAPSDGNANVQSQPARSASASA